MNILIMCYCRTFAHHDNIIIIDISTHVITSALNVAKSLNTIHIHLVHTVHMCKSVCTSSVAISLLEVNDETDDAYGKCDQSEVVDLWDTSKPASDKNGTGYKEALFREIARYYCQN